MVQVFVFICIFFLSLPDKTIKLWKISERDKRPEGYNLKEEDGRYKDPNTITSLRVGPSIMHTLTDEINVQVVPLTSKGTIFSLM